MIVCINEREYEYVSDYPQGWKFISKDYFKFPVSIGNNSCFIKRFQKRQENISGWDLLIRLKNKNEANVPRVYDIVSVEENRRQISYVFFECVKGNTMEALIRGDISFDLGRLTNDLLNAFESLHKYNFWFSDFCEKNIFCEERGRYLLIDTDSCEPVSEPPSNDMDVNMVYWALVYKFYRDILHIQLVPADIPGISLNHLQLIFLVLHLKLYSLDSNRHEYMSDQAFNDLPVNLDQTDPAFRNLFIRVLESAKQSVDLYQVSEIKSLILDKIIDDPSITEKPEIIEEAVIFKAPWNIEVPQAPEVPPVIKAFNSGSYTIKKGNSFVLTWEVENATRLELYKNGVIYITPGTVDTSAVISEPHESKDKKLLFSLRAINNAGQVKSEPLVINVTDTITILEGTTLSKPRKMTVLKSARVRIISALLLAVIFLALALLRNRTKAGAISIVDFAPKNVVERSTIVISGENFPADVHDVDVLFDNKKGAIQYHSKNMISVTVPELGNHLGDGITKVVIVAQGDTVYAPKNLMVRKKQIAP